MLKKIKEFLFYNYHRPSAKFVHVKVLIKKIFLNNKNNIFSERMLLLKSPPATMLYYNFIGRIFFYIFNLFSIIFLRKFADKSLKLEKEKENFHLKTGNDYSPWPQQAMHIFENEKQVDKNFLENLEKEYFSSSDLFEKNNQFDETVWWKECRNEFRNIFLKEKKINLEKLRNFRNDTDTKAEILLDQNFISRSNSNFINMIRSLSLVNLYHKLSQFIDLDILRICSESKIGNNASTIYRNQRIGYRILRYAYYLSQIRKFTDIDHNKKNLFLDIGGGYGGLSRVLKYFYKNSTIVLIELPELSLLANYFLNQCFPNAKICTSENIKDKESFKKEDLTKYDFVILPPSYLEKFQDDIIDLTINTTSLGEMTDQMQNFYVNQIERLTKKYFYSVNRAKKRVEKYNSNGFYNFTFNNKWTSLIYNYTHTYHIEFLGEKNEKENIK